MQSRRVGQAPSRCSDACRSLTDSAGPSTRLRCNCTFVLAVAVVRDFSWRIESGARKFKRKGQKGEKNKACLYKAHSSPCAFLSISFPLVASLLRAVAHQLPATAHCTNTGPAQEWIIEVRNLTVEPAPCAQCQKPNPPDAAKQRTQNSPDQTVSRTVIATDIRNDAVRQSNPLSRESRVTEPLTASCTVLQIPDIYPLLAARCSSRIDSLLAPHQITGIKARPLRTGLDMSIQGQTSSM